MVTVLRRIIFCRKYSLPIFVLLFAPMPAQANALLQINPQLASALLILLDSSSNCITYTYDENGNRLAIASSTVGSGSTLWGTAQFGCFSWDD